MSIQAIRDVDVRQREMVHLASYCNVFPSKLWRFGAKCVIVVYVGLKHKKHEGQGHPW